MTAALEGGEWSAAGPGRTLPRERPVTHFTGGWVGPRAGLSYPTHEDIYGHKEFCSSGLKQGVFLIKPEIKSIEAASYVL